MPFQPRARARRALPYDIKLVREKGGRRCLVQEKQRGACRATQPQHPARCHRGGPRAHSRSLAEKQPLLVAVERELVLVFTLHLYALSLKRTHYDSGHPCPSSLACQSPPAHCSCLPHRRGQVARVQTCGYSWVFGSSHFACHGLCHGVEVTHVEDLPSARVVGGVEPEVAAPPLREEHGACRLLLSHLGRAGMSLELAKNSTAPFPFAAAAGSWLASMTDLLAGLPSR
jgi:hypothetical protein